MLCIFQHKLSMKTHQIGAGYPLVQNFLSGFVEVSQLALVMAEGSRPLDPQPAMPLLLRNDCVVPSVL